VAADFAAAEKRTVGFGCYGRGLGKTALHPSRGAVVDIEARHKFRNGPAGELKESAAQRTGVEMVLFRLTHNLQRLLAPAGVDGPLANANAILVGWLAGWLSRPAGAERVRHLRGVARDNAHVLRPVHAARGDRL
jgi:hypothetical protein